MNLGWIGILLRFNVSVFDGYFQGVAQAAKLIPFVSDGVPYPTYGGWKL